MQELKPMFSLWATTASSAFNRTMQELKLPYNPDQAQGLLAFNRTMQELKRKWPGSCSGGQLPLIAPCRN